MGRDGPASSAASRYAQDVMLGVGFSIVFRILPYISPLGFACVLRMDDNQNREIVRSDGGVFPG